MDEVLVSIDCITYNHEKYIEDAIRSFLMQKTKFNYEILIHDDASRDSTADIIREYQNKHPNIIKAILEEENQMSKGIRRINYVFNHTRSKGKYIALCEGDDYWTDPYKLQKQVDYMEQHPDCGLCFHAAQRVYIENDSIDLIKPYKRSSIAPTEDLILGGGGYMATSSILYRKSTMDKVPSLYWDAPVGDYPLQLLTSVKNYAFYINDVMSVYRRGVIGSWTCSLLSVENKDEKLYKLYQETARMLHKFDQYTDHKYSESIHKKIMKAEIHNLITNKKLSDLNNRKYRKAFLSFSLKEKTHIILRFFKKLFFTNQHSFLSEKKRILYLIHYPTQNSLSRRNLKERQK